MEVRFKKLSENAVAPERAHTSDAGYDLHATEVYTDEHGKLVCKTGIAMEIPSGYAGFLFSRSSVAKKDLLLSNAVGVIDSGYRGEIMMKFAKIGNDVYKAGEKVGQIIIMPVPDIEYVESDSLDDSDRGEGGYGSTGEK